ncbi:LysE family transporter [Azospirillum sp. TSO22-1]|uniref:LysE family transporter n=1 Tax=Azospirillum sp. TSO22-1 TaxID=716789 RepID=UPI000D61C9E3|nr:LysE family transporter [Azospirillum sp. TSO22-1]PWC56362.1 lysine transporter LysE [Azospirillum sp. TSO22-1]
MDTTFLFLKGAVIGLSIAAPVGPIGLLCIRRTLADGAAVGFATGLGAATADAAYGAVAGFGLAAVTDLLLGWQTALRLVGGLVLLWLGFATMRAHPAKGPAEQAAETPTAHGLAGAYATTVVLTLANPATIISFVAVFGALGLAEAGGAPALGASMLVLGVFLGSAAWWLVLSAGVGVFRRRVTAAAMLWINRASGAVLAGFGLLALAAAL